MSTASTEVSLSILCSRYIRIVQIDDFHSYISFSRWMSRSELSAVSNLSPMLKARGNRTFGNWQKQRKYRYCKDQLSIIFLISSNQRETLSAFYKTELRCSASQRNEDFLNSISPIWYLQHSIADACIIRFSLSIDNPWLQSLDLFQTSTTWLHVRWMKKILLPWVLTAGRKTTRSMQNKTSTKTDRSIRSDFALTARYWQATTSFTSIEFADESRDPEKVRRHCNELPRHYTKQREFRNTSKDYPNSPWEDPSSLGSPKAMCWENQILKTCCRRAMWHYTSRAWKQTSRASNLLTKSNRRKSLQNLM
jgi:hypothetical protein